MTTPDKSDTMLNGLKEISSSLVGTVLSKKEIAEKLYEGLSKSFELTNIHVFFLTPASTETDYSYPSDSTPQFPVDFEWVLNFHKTVIANKELGPITLLHVYEEVIYRIAR